MPAVLSDTQVCHPYVPLRWQPVLQDLVQFQCVEQSLCGNPDDDLLRQAGLLHAQLVDRSAALLEPRALDDFSDAQAHTIFARSVLLLIRLAQAVAGDDEVLDTAGSQVLSLYEADFLADPAHQARLRQALLATCNLDEARLNQLDAEVEADAQQALRKQAVVRALRDHFGLWPDSSSELRNAVFRLFDAIHPDVGIEPEEIELIVCGGMIFFCLPFEKDTLTTQRFAELDSDGQQPIREFLGRVTRFDQYQFAHFPVFGFRRGSELSEDLLEQIAERCGLSSAEVAEEITTMTAVVPLDQIDKYVVHDLWGHSWQAGLLHFDRMYQEIATFADPLDLDEQARSPLNEQLRLADCFVGPGDQLQLDEAAFRRFVDLEVAERLPIAMTPVLAEVLADVAEFKLLDTQRTEHLPSSSILAHFPAKLDLTIIDVGYYFRQATKVFRLWAQREKRQQRTIDQLVQRGADRSAAARAVARAAAIWCELEEEWFAHRLEFHPEGEQLRVNVISRVALNFLAIHRETLRVYRRLGQLPAGQLPLRGFRDLLLICVAVFFETAPSRNLWRVDEFLSLRMEPLCERLAEHSR